MSDPHPASEALAFLGAGEIVERLERGELTSEALLEALLERVAVIDAPEGAVGLSSIAALSPDALSLAHARDEERSRGALRGALHGVPVVVKDNIEASGLPGVAGSTALLGREAREAPLVARLREAGAVVVASTNLSQWANIRSPHSTSGYSATGGLVANPWSLDRSAGGSSSGSGAALAAGLTPLAVGTETDGSIVCPSSLNGVVGLKPTVGSVPARYVVPISASQDSPGPMARSVEDVARLYEVLAASQPPVGGAAATFAAALNWRTGHPATDQLFDDLVVTMRDDGLSVSSRELALPDDQVGADELTVLLSELADDLSAYLLERPGEGVASLADVVAFEEANRGAELAHFGHEHFVAALATGGRAGEAYASARQRNLAWATTTCLSPGLDGVDFVLAPTYGPAWKCDLVLGDNAALASPVTTASAIAGWPLLCLPMGLVEGLPVGVALVGRANSEWAMIQAARLVERAVAIEPDSWRPRWKAPARG